MSARHCPVCGTSIAPADARARHAPFCSPRCADIDLGRWFTGQYRIPVEGDENDAEEVDPSDRTG